MAALVGGDHLGQRVHVCSLELVVHVVRLVGCDELDVVHNEKVWMRVDVWMCVCVCVCV